MTISQLASAFSRVGVWLRHGQAAKRGRLPQRAVNYGLASLVARAMRRLWR